MSIRRGGDLAHDVGAWACRGVSITKGGVGRKADGADGDGALAGAGVAWVEAVELDEEALVSRGSRRR